MHSVSCIVPVFNAAEFLDRAVESLLACRIPDLEIVLVDDGSTDQSLQVARSLADRYPGLQILTHEQNANRGVSATRNLGIERSRGDLICFLDADDYVYPHRFDEALKILNSQPEIDGVYDLTEVVFADEAARVQWPETSTTFGFTENILPEQLLGRLLTGRCWATSAIVVRRSLLSETGLFDPSLSIAEDCNLWFRMASVGRLICGDLDRPVSVYWRTSGSAFRPAADRKLQMLQSMHLFVRWLKRRRNLDSAVQQSLSMISDYAVNGLISVRTQKRRKLAWSLVYSSVRMFPSLLLDRRFQRQLLSMFLGR